jgi:hypothetical protein
VNRIPNLVSAACLAAACMSCKPAPPLVPPRDFPVQPQTIAPLQKAIVVRDDYTVALFAEWSSVTKPTSTSTATIRFYDRKKQVIDKIKVFNQVPGSGFVYAPRDRPAKATRENISHADRAEVTIGSDVYPIDLRKALSSPVPGDDDFVGTIDPCPDCLDPCPDCLIYFLCHCLQTLYSVAPSVQCPEHYDPNFEHTCTMPDLQPVR